MQIKKNVYIYIYISNRGAARVFLVFVSSPPTLLCSVAVFLACLLAVACELICQNGFILQHRRRCVDIGGLNSSANLPETWSLPE